VDIRRLVEHQSVTEEKSAALLQAVLCFALGVCHTYITR
jgi:hypothetical protein